MPDALGVPELQPLPEPMLTLGGDPTVMRDELLWMIRAHIDAHPRSQQTIVGPSELGTPCTRRLGYRLAGVAPVNPRSGAWKPTVGTAVHSWLQTALESYNARHDVPRFYLEQRVHVGDVGGQPVTGSADVYDRFTATVVDWKVVGSAGLRRYRIDGPGEQYRAQAHLYGRGFTNAGLPVEHVAVMFLPQNGELTEAHYWSEPYDETVALEALRRADTVAGLVGAAGAQIVPALPATDAFCAYCPWHTPVAFTDTAQGCPGAAHSPGTAPTVPVTAAPAAA